MTNKILEIPDYTDDQIEDIIKKVEEAKPWTCDLVRRSEIFLLSVCTNTIFTFLGLHLSVLLWFAYPEIIHKYSVMMGYNNMAIMSCVPIVITFLLIDVYLYFYPSQFDKMTIREWCHLVLKKQDFGKRISYILFYGYLFFSIMATVIWIYSFKITPFIFLFILCNIIILSFIYQKMNIILGIFKENNHYRNLNLLDNFSFLISFIPINLGIILINSIVISIVNIFQFLLLAILSSKEDFFYNITSVIFPLMFLTPTLVFITFHRTLKISYVVNEIKNKLLNQNI